jgi:hypothetical protein
MPSFSICVADEGFEDDLAEEDGVDRFNLVPIGAVIFSLIKIRVCCGFDFLYPPTHDL